jgi:D-alanyl-lipoteichoic acid acyltransferase DltB (MBOAT superfamily)
VRAEIFLEQTVHPSDPRQIELAASVFLIVGGLFKKVIVANYLAADFVDDLFRAPTGHTSLDLWLGMYAYAIQIYCDFSAYTDIAIGIASLLGYRFPQNFNQPYRALTVQDFWRRWHITLSTWLRDYLYIPLGGNRGSQLATYRNILITMGLGGLWHGASFNFVIWGLLHGGALVVERMLGITADNAHERRMPARIVMWLVTFHLVCFAWVFFRAASFDDSMTYFATMFGAGRWTTEITPLVAVCLLLGAVTQIIPPDWSRDLKLRYELAPISLKVAVPFVIIYVIAIAAPRGVPPFIYFQF